MSSREYLHKLYLLQDLDLLLQQVEDPEYTAKTGLEINEERIELIKQRRDELARELQKADPITYEMYEKLKKRYGRGITRVVDDMCTNCFVALPSSMMKTEDRIETCPNCGIILIWLD
ncbi:MAG: hypothetical protein GXO29_06650 [Thermotogae bacterium]|nr:hypothetical protein [Thermotogota bacterium]